MNEIVLDGCTPAPLAHCLEALGMGHLTDWRASTAELELP